MPAKMENPALASGAPKSDLAGALIGSEFIASLPAIQADAAAELEFARRLAVAVFGKPTPTFQLAHKRRRLRVWRPAR